MELKELNKKEIGARIRARRELLGMTRDEMAKYLEVTPKFIADIEYGDKGVSLRTLYNIKQVLGVSADFLLEGNEDIMGSLSVCSVKQLSLMERMARLYVEGIVDRD